MAVNVGCEFRDRGLIPNMCQITDTELGQVGQLNDSLSGGLLQD